MRHIYNNVVLFLQQTGDAMKKLFGALLCAFPLSTFAFLSASTTDDVEYYNDFSLTVNKLHLSFDQNGDWGKDETRLGWGNLSFITSETLDFGITYKTSWDIGMDGEVFSLSSGINLHDDTIWELDTSFVMGNSISVKPSMDWNLSDANIIGEVELGYALEGIDATSNLIYDLDDMDYNGSEFGLGYTFSVNESVSLRPNLLVPFDAEWAREGDIEAGISVKITFAEPAPTATQ